MSLLMHPLCRNKGHGVNDALSLRQLSRLRLTGTNVADQDHVSAIADEPQMRLVLRVRMERRRPKKANGTASTGGFGGLAVADLDPIRLRETYQILSRRIRGLTAPEECNGCLHEASCTAFTPTQSDLAFQVRGVDSVPSGRGRNL